MTTQELTIDVGEEEPMAGTLTLPDQMAGLVLFAHGSGSSRFSPRNIFVADYLNEAGLGTLLLDLLTPSEAREDEYNARFRFDIDLLASRLLAGTRHCAESNGLRNIPFGYFGASTGAAAALIAEVDSPVPIAAIVSRGGRPDLAAPALSRVRAPTLLIVGGNDDVVIGLNRQALAALTSTKQLEIVPGATHLFEEPGTLERVAELSRDWFRRHMTHTTS
jgi:pimeloyl-ACP methyl ester carboxylesterase